MLFITASDVKDMSVDAPESWDAGQGRIASHPEMTESLDECPSVTFALSTHKRPTAFLRCYSGHVSKHGSGGASHLSTVVLC